MTNINVGGANLRGAVDLSSLVRPPVAAKGTAGPGSGHAEAPAGNAVVRSATDATFTEVLELSSTVPVIVEFYGQGIEPSLAQLISGYSGRVALVTVDATSNPQLVQAFRVEQVPTVAAVVGGRPLQLFVGMLAEQELRDVIEQVLQVASQNGVNGTIAVDAASGSPTADAGVVPVEEPLPPHHQEAYDAIAAGDFTAAIAEYETAIAQNPRDQLAVAGLAQVSLLARLAAVETSPAGEPEPGDVEANLVAADLDVAGGRLEGAFGRLLDLFPALDAADKNTVRTRLLQYFEIAGTGDPLVIAARRRLTWLLY